jgi:hypothetical protein
MHYINKAFNGQNCDLNNESSRVPPRPHLKNRYTPKGQMKWPDVAGWRDRRVLPRLVDGISKVWVRVAELYRPSCRATDKADMEMKFRGEKFWGSRNSRHTHRR